MSRVLNSVFCISCRQQQGRPGPCSVLACWISADQISPSVPWMGATGTNDQDSSVCVWMCGIDFSRAGFPRILALHPLLPAFAHHASISFSPPILLTVQSPLLSQLKVEPVAQIHTPQHHGELTGKPLLWAAWERDVSVQDSTWSKMSKIRPEPDYAVLLGEPSPFRISFFFYFGVSAFTRTELPMMAMI